MNAKEYEMTNEEFHKYLYEIYGTVNICGYDYDAGWAFEEIDPTGFNCAKSDYESSMGYQCGECGAQHDDEEDAEMCCRPNEGK